MKKLFALAAVITIAVILSPIGAPALDWEDYQVDVNYSQQIYSEYSTAGNTFSSWSEGGQFSSISIGGSIPNMETFGAGVRASVFQAQGHSSTFDVPGGTAYTFSESQTQSWVSIGTPPTFNTTTTGN